MGKSIRLQFYINPTMWVAICLLLASRTTRIVLHRSNDPTYYSMPRQYTHRAI